ncbi:hypothetical protein SAY86_015477 [Trapa natans]|uniref:Uncharacterized protein n=1 Tax=Trapa natans TaxID=22666 RepID=A0AAN7LI14_TRANT|nr:hypothetical protein SAY86_015477 [Trapa natans]
MQGVSLSYSNTLLSPSPSLSCRTSGSVNLAEIAARVAREFSLQEDGAHDGDDFFSHCSQTELPRLDGDGATAAAPEEYDGGDGDFEFTFACGVPGSSPPVSADEIFHNGQIKPVYEYTSLSKSRREDYRNQRPHRPPLKLLMSEDDRREGDPPAHGLSCSSLSESEEREGAAPGTYCAWVPREDTSNMQCTKRSSSRTGSWRWKLKHLLLPNRCNSDGRTDMLSAIPAAAAKSGPTAENHRGGRRSYLLDRAELADFFTNVNGLGRNLHPFR